MLTLKSSEEEFKRLKYEKEMNSSSRIRKRCLSVYMKLTSSGMSSKAIGLLLGCCRTSVDRWLHSYAAGGLSSLLHEEMYRPCSELKVHKVMDFLRKARGRYGNKPIAIVMDNARYQHCSLVTNKASELNIKILFLPPYSPNLNILERLWKFTKKKLLYGKYYDTPRKNPKFITFSLP